jgi:selenide,water dikinase
MSLMPSDMTLDVVGAVRDLVLVGGGHAHVEVLRRFGLRPPPAARVTVISRDRYTPYSGMLPGLIAGHYSFEASHIDLEVVAAFAGARLIQDEVVALDPIQRSVRCASGRELRSDVLSIDVGSTPPGGWRKSVKSARNPMIGPQPCCKRGAFKACEC